MEITSTLPCLLRELAGLGTGTASMLLIRSRTEGYAGINKLHKLIIQNKYRHKVTFNDRVLLCVITFHSSPSSSALKSQQPGCCHSILYQHGFSSAFFFHQLLTVITFLFFSVVTLAFSSLWHYKC